MISEKLCSEVVAASSLQLGTMGPPVTNIEGVPKEGEGSVCGQAQNDTIGQSEPVCFLEYVVGGA